jgi:hypothetical protein
LLVELTQENGVTWRQMDDMAWTGRVEMMDRNGLNKSHYGVTRGRVVGRSAGNQAHTKSAELCYCMGERRDCDSCGM